MRPPRLPPMAADIIRTALQAMDGAVFSELSVCPSCGGPVSGYDYKDRQFAILDDQGTPRPVHVRVKRFRCRHCNRLCYADQPFYPGTRIGSPVIDLCITLAEGMPAGRVARVLLALGVRVDRTSCLLITRRFGQEIKTADVFGVRLPFSILALSNLAARSFDEGPVRGSEALAACGFPSSYRAAPDLSLQNGQDRNTEDQEEERHSRAPESRHQDD